METVSSHVCVNNLAGQCRTTVIRDQWDRTESWCRKPECRCRTNFSPAFRHLHMIFLFHIAITPSAAVYGRAGCITFHCLQFGRALGIPFTTTNTSRMDVQDSGCIGIPPAISTCWALPFPSLAWCCMDAQVRVYPFRSQQYAHAGCIPSSLNVQCVIHFAASSMDVHLCMVYHFPPPVVLTYRVYPFPHPAKWTRRVYYFQQPAVWTSLHPASSLPPPAVCTCRVYPFPQPAVWTCMVYSLPPPAVWTCRVCPFLPPVWTIGHAGCTPFLNAGMSDCPVPKWTKNADAGTSPVPE